jgi:hypothetical protein
MATTYPTVLLIGASRGLGLALAREYSALNQLMRSYAARHRDDTRTLLLTAPGWVRTELGGPDARLTVDESIPRLVGVVDAQHGHGGLRFLDCRGETVPW